MLKLSLKVSFKITSLLTAVHLSKRCVFCSPEQFELNWPMPTNYLYYCWLRKIAPEIKAILKAYV